MGWSLRLGSREFLIVAEGFVVGRGEGVDLRLDEDSVSRRHAQFRIEGELPMVWDLQSRNGTFVNGQPIAGRARLSPGDRITLGACELLLIKAERVPEPYNEAVTRPVPRDGLASYSGPRGLAALSPREREMFALIAEGQSQRQIADHFKLSIKTVETHRTRIGQKLGLRSRADLIRCALEAGVLMTRGETQRPPPPE
jgi:DNA-binding CsgD family transcriptional regulator